MCKSRRGTDQRNFLAAQPSSPGRMLSYFRNDHSFFSRLQAPINGRAGRMFRRSLAATAMVLPALALWNVSSRVPKSAPTFCPSALLPFCPWPGSAELQHHLAPPVFEFWPPGEFSAIQAPW